MTRRPLPGLLLVAAGALLAGACSDSAAYEGEGTDHEFVGRSLEELERCSPSPCMGSSVGTLDGVEVAVLQDLSKGQTMPMGDAACIIDRVGLVVDGDEIVAAWVTC